MALRSAAPSAGVPSVSNTITPSAVTTKAEFEILAIASCGGTVMTERIDRFEIGGKSIALPVMGAFENTPQGAISAWRDYFDMAQFTSQMG